MALIHGVTSVNQHMEIRMYVSSEKKKLKKKRWVYWSFLDINLYNMRIRIAVNINMWSIGHL